MADSVTAARNLVEKWEREFNVEYLRKFQFLDLMGPGSNNVIVTKKLTGDGDGTKLTIPVIYNTDGEGVTGNQTLMGSEEEVDNLGHQLTVTYYRHAVKSSKEEDKKAPFSFMKAKRDVIMNWHLRKRRSLLIDALCSPNVDGKTPYASCTEPQKDAWLVANSDRIRFGAGVGGFTDHSVDLALLDTTADICKKATIIGARDLAEAADPAIQPYVIDDREEMWLCVLGSKQFSALKSDLGTDLQNAEVRGRDNPIWRNGDLMIDGVLCRKVPEMPVLANVGDSGTTDVGIGMLLGAQAIGFGIGSNFKTVTELTDYKFKIGVAGEMMYGIEKLNPTTSDSHADPVQHGAVTIYTAVA